MVNLESTEWTGKEIATAVAVLDKIAFCQHNAPVKQYPLPGPVFEALCRAKKNVSTELVVFNQQGEVFLFKRPSREEKPHEPYPDMLHSPGATHMLTDSIASAVEKIRTEELGGVAIRYLGFVGITEMHDPPRGPYLGLIHHAQVGETPRNPRGRFYSPDEILREENLVPSHWTIISRALSWRREELPILIDLATF